MALNVNTGVVDPSDRLSTELVEGVSDVLHLIDVQRFPLWSILQALPQPPALNTQVKWNAERNRPVHATLAATASSAATTLTVATGQGAYFKAGDLVAVFGDAQPEIVSVSSVVSDALTVVRSVGDTAAAAATAGAALLILGPAVAQGSDLASSIYVQAASGYNYAEIFRTPIEFTGSEFETGKYGNKRNAKSIANRLNQHVRQLENTLFFGARSYTSNSGSGHPLGTSGGLAEFISGAAIGGTLSASGFDTNLDKVFGAGSGRKVIFAGSVAARGLQTVYATNFLPNLTGKKLHGVKPDFFVNTPYGAVPGFTKGDWNMSYSDTEPTVSGPKNQLFLVDLAHVAWRPLRKTRLVEDQAEPGEDRVEQAWLTEGALEVATVESHGILSGITG